MITTPPRELIGNSAIEKWCNQLLRWAKSCRVTSVTNGGLDVRPEGTIIRCGGGGGGGSSPAKTPIYACRVSLVFANCLQVYTIDPNPNPIPNGAIMVNNQWTFYAALPFLLRTNPAPTQGAVIFPPYLGQVANGYQGDEVLVTAASGLVTTNAVSGALQPIVRDPLGNPIYFIIIDCARYWAIKTPVCNGAGQIVNRWFACSADNSPP